MLNSMHFFINVYRKKLLHCVQCIKSLIVITLNSLISVTFKLKCELTWSIDVVDWLGSVFFQLNFIFIQLLSFVQVSRLVRYLKFYIDFFNQISQQ